MYSNKWRISRQVGARYLYSITTKQGNFEIISEKLNYKVTINNLRAKGYTNIYITCIGRAF